MLVDTCGGGGGFFCYGDGNFNAAWRENVQTFVWGLSEMAVEQTADVSCGAGAAQLKEKSSKVK